MLKKNTAYNYANRELSWLKFNERVLSQTSDSKIPLLERVRFLSIAFSNLDEFFMVRVAGLNVQKFSRNKSFDGLTPQQQLKLIDKETSKMISNIKSIWIDLLRELSENKIHIDVEKTLKTKDKTFIKNYLEENKLGGFNANYY
jgi:Polyphosphate kinase